VPDYVFGKGYAVKPLPEVGRFIAEHGHLPGVPTARDVTTQGARIERLEELIEDMCATR